MRKVLEDGFRQIKTGKSNYTRITDETISRIAKIKAFEDSSMNNRLYEFHKQLLRRAQKYDGGNREVGLFWDLNHVEEAPLVIIGNRNSIEIRQNERVNYLVRNCINVSNVVMMHNHPRNGLFSSVDIQSFIDFNSIFMMTAVCNDGTIYMLKKEIIFDPFLARKYYNDGCERSDKESRQYVVKKAKELGLDVNNSEDRKRIQQIQTRPYYYGIKNLARHAKEIGVIYRCSVKKRGVIR